MDFIDLLCRKSVKQALCRFHDHPFCLAAETKARSLVHEITLRVEDEAVSVSPKGTGICFLKE